VLAERGIAVNCVAPGATITPMLDAASPTPNIARASKRNSDRRAGEPAEIAEAIVWLLSPRSSMSTAKR